MIEIMSSLENWDKVKSVVDSAFLSSLNFAIATVNEDGSPHVTPIGSFFLAEPGTGYYFEKFSHKLPDNLSRNSRVCVMAVNSSKIFWLHSLIKGRFSISPGVRLHGCVSNLRPATQEELSRWRKRVMFFSPTKGHKLMWRQMHMVREIRIDRVDPIKIGKMTTNSW